MNTQRLRQIAILVDSLDTAAADRLLDSLPVELQQRVRDAVMDLDQVTDSERQYVLNEFRRGRSSGDGTTDNSPASPPATAADSGRHNSSHSGQGSGAGLSSPTYRPARGPAPLSNPVTSVWPNTSTENDPDTPTRGVDWSATAQWPAGGTAASEPGSSAATAQLRVAPAAAAPLDLADTLASVDLDSLAAVVLRESPPVLAAVLSLLPPLKAAQLLEVCPATLQAAALQRLQYLTELDDEIMGFLQQELQTVIRQRQKLRQRQRVGSGALADILVAAQRLQSATVSQAVQSQLHGQPSSSASTRRTHATPLALASERVEQPDALQRPAPWTSPAPIATAPTATSAYHGMPHTPIPASIPASSSEPRQSSTGSLALNASGESRLATPELEREDALSDHVPRLEFAELVRCDNGSLQALLATAKPQLTLLALRGAEPALLERILRMLPRSEAQEVRFRVQNIGPTRIQDIQQAQQYLLRLASLLEDLGRFRRPKSGSRWRAAA